MNMDTTTLAETLNIPDWTEIVADLEREGYAMLPGYLANRQVSQLAEAAGTPSAGAYTSLQDLDLGRGDVWRASSSAHNPPLDWTQALFDRLWPVAARWDQIMSTRQGPTDCDRSWTSAKGSASARMFVEMTRLREGEYQALHQKSATFPSFPLQLIALLSEPDSDFSGGQFVMTEQRPRMQSRPMVLQLRKGDVAIITTAHRPFKGSKGYYRVNLKHAISRVRSGERLGMEISLTGTPRAADE
ncbi:MAG: prolyl 4-hydroxylase [Ramlibacter sp.]|nr:prolyl 4-hydroxylase [Ramlibacter sp.]